MQFAASLSLPIPANSGSCIAWQWHYLYLLLRPPPLLLPVHTTTKDGTLHPAAAPPEAFLWSQLSREDEEDAEEAARAWRRLCNAKSASQRSGTDPLLAAEAAATVGGKFLGAIPTLATTTTYYMCVACVAAVHSFAGKEGGGAHITELSM